MCFNRKKKWYFLGLAGETAQALEIDPVNSNVLYAGTYEAATSFGNIYKSTDKGVNWVKILSDKRIESIAINPVDSQIIYAAAYTAELYKSDDGGATWSTLTGLPATTLRCLAVDPVVPNIVYCGNISGQVFKSIDAGATWVEKSSGIDSAAGFRGPKDIIIKPSDTSTLYAGTNAGVYKSTDGAENWIKLNDVNVLALTMDPNNADRLYCSADNQGRNRVTGDAGASWDPLDFRVFDYEVRPCDSNVIFEAVMNPGGVYRSMDKGETWESIGLDQYSVRELALSDVSKILYAAVQYRHTDARIGGVYCNKNILR